MASHLVCMSFITYYPDRSRMDFFAGQGLAYGSWKTTYELGLIFEAG